MLTDKEKIEVLKDLIKTRQMAVTQRGNDELVTQAQQWLAELDSENDGWDVNNWIHADYSLPASKKMVEVLHSNFFEKKLISTGYYSDNGTWYGSSKSGQILFVKAWRPITPPTT